MSSVITGDLSTETWKPSSNIWLITIAVMLSTFVVALDGSIANVALPQMAGSFSATQDESLWIITSYLVANGVVLPATAWFSSIFGRKSFLIICIIVFGTASFLCGISTSMDMIILFRILQGFGGGALVPISQAILLESFPKEKHALANSIFGLGVILAPVMGPVLGGWLTDTYSWNWIFFINIPICIIALIMSQIFIEDPPYMQKKGMQKIDYLGFAALTLWLITLQVALDNGQKSDWFGSSWVCWTSLTSAISLTVLVFWELKCKKPLFDLKVFKNRNFTLGTTIFTIIIAVLYASMVILPLFLQSLLGYSSYHSGIAASPMGVGSLIAIIFTGVLANRIDLRKQVALGLILMGLSCYMFGNLNLDISINNIILPNIIFGAGVALALVPLTTLIFSTLKNEEMTNAAGLQNLLKNVGGAVGTSLVSTMISRFSQVHQFEMVKQLSSQNPAFLSRYSDTMHFLSGYMNPVIAATKANYLMYVNLIKQSYLCAYMDCYRTYALIVIILIPTVFLITKIKFDKNKIGSSSIH